VSEHYTKNTIEASAWCDRCHRATMHRVDNGRRGPCLECMARPEAEPDSTRRKPPAGVQMDLFRKGGTCDQ
jgi:hypothetical protein